MAPHCRTPMARRNPHSLGTSSESEDVGVDWAADAKKKGEQIAMLEQKVLNQEVEVLTMRQISKLLTANPEVADAVDDLKGETLDSLIYYRNQVEILEERLSSLQPIPPSPQIANGQPLWTDNYITQTPDCLTPRAPTVSPLTPLPQGMMFPPIAPPIPTPPVAPPIAPARRQKWKRTKGQNPERTVLERKCKVRKYYKV